MVSRDCSAIHSVHDIFLIVQATIGAGLWLTFQNVQVLVGRDDHLLSSLLGCILTVRTAIGGKRKPIVVGGESIVPSSKPIRISMLYNGQIPKIGMIPLSLQTLFRPLCMFEPQRKLLLEKMLCLFDVPFSSLLAVRLASVCDHFVSREVLSDKDATRCMIRAVKETGYINKIEPATLDNGIGWNIFTKFIKHIPNTTRRYILIDDVKFVVNLFLDTVFMDDEKTIGYLLKNPLTATFRSGQHHNTEERMSEFQKTLLSLPGHRAIDVRSQQENDRIKRHTAILIKQSKESGSFDLEDKKQSQQR